MNDNPSATPLVIEAHPAAGEPAAGSRDLSGEHVSVHSQKDADLADLALERTELRVDDKG